MATEPISAAPNGQWYIVNEDKEKDEAEILIYDVIGGWGITAQSFIDRLKNITAKTINIRLNTPGGEVFDATAIYNALRSHPARVVAYVDGVAASAGSVIAMSGDEVRMADNSYMMIHEAHGGVMGEAGEMRKYADLLEKINDNIAGSYQKKTGKSRKYWRDKMADESWFTADEAKAEGLSDATFTASKKAEGAKANFDFKIYNKIPDAVKAMWGITNQTSPPAPEPSQSSEPAQALPKETQPMAETSTIVAPAQTPAAGSSVTQENQQQQLSRLTNDAISRHIESGKVVGRAEGRQALMDEFRAIVGACAGRPQTAVNAFLAGQNASHGQA
jgi:ATP-dependent protease ClpP protease subunit